MNVTEFLLVQKKFQMEYMQFKISTIYTKDST